MLLLLASCFSPARAKGAGQETNPELVIAPSASSLAGGTAKLQVEPLHREGGRYVGGYQIKVIPYFFMNEGGSLYMEVSEAQLQQMVAGGATSFSGLAQAEGSPVQHKIAAKPTPSSNGRGALSFTVATDNGSLVFATSYQIVWPES